jgi:formylglycine-generating enzyme required for sulfatase activity
VLDLVARIQAVDPEYRDVAQWRERALRALQTPPSRRIPWRWIAGFGTALLAVVCLALAIAFGSRFFSSTSTPTTTIREADGMVMVYVPGGTFQMGSEEGSSDERPVHTVTLDSFWIDQTKVTNAQYATFLNDLENQAESDVTWLELEDEDCLIEHIDGEFQPKSGYADHPVIEVSWHGAAAYCEWAWGRLPTEAEWEYAARGPQVYTYPWGNRDPTCDLAQYSGCPGEKVEVGSFPDGASWCGALDMAGNVWEWVADWYDADYYETSPSNNPTGPEWDKYRVLRGGSWNSPPDDMRSANRHRQSPDITLDYAGFRCVRGGGNH